MKKQIVEQEITMNFEWEGLMVDIDIDTAIADLVELKNKGATHLDFGDLDFYALIRREETDEEYQKRLKFQSEQEYSYNKIIEKKELAEFDRIKKKYGL